MAAKNPNKVLGASTRERLMTGIEKAQQEGYVTDGEVTRSIKLWSGNLYQMMFVQRMVLTQTVQHK